MFEGGDGTPILGDFLAAERESVLDGLSAWVRIPSIGAQPGHHHDVENSAEWCAERMASAGLEHVEVLPTPGHPAVYGDWLHAEGAITALGSPPHPRRSARHRGGEGDRPS